MARWMQLAARLGAGFVLVIAFAVAASAQDATWPRELKTEKGILTIYQPQPEKFENNMLQARAAASLVPTGKTTPVFGVFWFNGRVDTDRDAGTALLRDITVTNARWPESTEPKEKEITAFLTSLMPKTGIPISLERLKHSLAALEDEKKSIEGLKHDPPKVVVLQEPAELLLYDGEPKTLPIKDTQFEFVANCAFAVIKDKKDGSYYLSGGKIWYAAKDPKGPWTSIPKPPDDVAKLVPKDTTSTPAPKTPPKIVVATEPTELITSDGPPNWQPVGGKSELMYIKNTESKVVREVSSGKIFVLISGRWFEAKSMDGAWTIVRPDQLPAAFKDIPPASDLGTVRVSVAGTPEAEDAMLDAYVPQTAAIDKSKAKTEVKYDGEPKFKKVSGTKVEYAENTASKVLKIDNRYYVCDQAVWYVSNSAKGPFAVADSVPMEEIKKIPPSEPVYNVTHVTVYESTPEVVYVGYTPGYTWSYPWYGVPVYGTGWYYPPYWGSVYYPHPVTYGYHVGYTPYYGWGMGFAYSVGFFTMGVMWSSAWHGYYGGFYGGYHGHYHGGYYPPGGYRPGGIGGVGGVGGAGGVGGVGGAGRPGGGASTLPAGSGGRGNSASTLPANNNLYNQGGNRDRNAASAKTREAGMQKADRVAKGKNNVYADRGGNVQRQTSNGWQSRGSNGSWNNSSPSQGMNRDAQARQRGSSSSYRGGGYSGSRGGSYGGSRGGGSRGGGGRGGGGRR